MQHCIRRPMNINEDTIEMDSTDAPITKKTYSLVGLNCRWPTVRKTFKRSPHKTFLNFVPYVAT